MDLRTSEELFEATGCSFLYEKFSYQLYISNLLGNVDIEVLEKFLLCYDFVQGDSLFFDEFAFHFRIFANIHSKNQGGFR